MDDHNYAERIAQIFHEYYTETAPFIGWKTQSSTKVDWAYLPERNRLLMIAVVARLLADGMIAVGPWFLTDDI